MYQKITNERKKCGKTAKRRDKMPYLFNDDKSKIELSTAAAPYITALKTACWGWLG